MRGRRAGIGIEVEEDQVGLRAFAQALQCVADAQSQARVVAQPQMLAGQARNRRAQLDGLGLLQWQVAQAGLGQLPAPKPRNNARRGCEWQSPPSSMARV